MNNIYEPGVWFKHKNLSGQSIDYTTRTLKDLRSIFNDKQAFESLPEDKLVYHVESYFPVKEGTEGGLFYGITYIQPGTVGNEYFMTKGHFHQVRNRAEVYLTIQGEGMLILMDEHRNTWAEKMHPGSIHYINGHVAHRTANTGDKVFSFGAFWPADAGHDYDTITQDGFSRILVSENGIPALVSRK